MQITSVCQTIHITQIIRNVCNTAGFNCSCCIQKTSRVNRRWDQHNMQAQIIVMGSWPSRRKGKKKYYSDVEFWNQLKVFCQYTLSRLPKLSKLVFTPVVPCFFLHVLTLQTQTWHFLHALWMNQKKPMRTIRYDDQGKISIYTQYTKIVNFQFAMQS